jgi:uncharacterized protein YbjQ (UPF0145 family)
VDDLVIFLVLLGIGYVAGRANEAKHYRSLRNRERASMRMPVITDEVIDPAWNVQKVALVSGCTVVSVDYFKRIAAALRNFFGGRVSAYESLLDRARRESILRMKEQALREGLQVIVNARLETSSISGMKGNNKGIASVEIFAYGTGLKIR